MPQRRSMSGTLSRRPVATALASLAVAAMAIAGCAAPESPVADDADDVTPVATPSEPVETETGAESAPPEIAVVDSSVDAAQEAAQARDAAVPVTLRYDRLGTDMAVDPVGVADDGQMEIPDDAYRAGWYEYGPGAGVDAGSTVLAAHAGTYATPRGPFHGLTEAEVGDVVEVERADGTVVRYRVSEVATIEKDTIDLRPFFARDGAPQLVLITCGGVWNEARQSYESNVVVTALPIDD